MTSFKTQSTRQKAGTKINTALAGLGLFAAAALTPFAASAQTVVNEPAFRFGDAPLLAPNSSAVTSYYSNQTHTEGHGAGRPDEIVSLAAGLDHDPDLILEYVRDNVEFYPTFGLGKGALGAHLDKSGTSFDQAHLVAQLLEEAEANGSISISNVKIKYGTLTLNGANAAQWLGVSNAGEACRLLARGGIPGRVNNSTNCAGLSGSITAVELGHAWVEATVGGQTERYDAAYKSYETIAPFTVGSNDFRDAMASNCSNTYALTAGAPTNTGTQSGSPFAKSFNYTGLQNHLNACAQSLWTWIENNKPNASVEEILGHRKITPGAPSGASYSASSSWDWNKVPDTYRVKFTVEIDRPNVPVTLQKIELSFDLFMDEVYGKRVSLVPNGFGDGNPVPNLNTLGFEDICIHNDFHYTLRLYVGTATQTGMQGPCHPAGRGAYTTIKTNAPYAASGGTYQDKEFFTNNHTLVTRAVFVVSAGETSSDWARYYQKNLGADRLASTFWNGVVCCGTEPEPPAVLSSGARTAENVRYRIFAAWAEQFSNLQKLMAGVAEAPIQHHYTVGWSYGYSQVASRCESSSCELTLGDDVAVLSLDTAMSTPANDPALNRTLANAAAALEASVMEQQLDSTASGGVAYKFRWGNLTSRPLPSGVTLATPHGTDPTGAFPVYRFTSSSNLDVLTSDGDSDCVQAFIANCLEGSLQYGIQTYLDAGYEVIAVGDAFLGPGLRCGEYYFVPTNPENFVGSGHWHCKHNASRGGAFIAYKPDFSAVAHVALTGQRLAKGGGAGSSIPEELRVVDIPTPADLLKEEEEDAFLHTADLRTGRLNLSTGPLITAGTGAFPYSLPFSRSFQSGDSGPTDPVWSHNWHMPLSISGSGNETLGSSRAIFASQSLAYLTALYGAFSDTGTSAQARIKQETVGALAAAWWSDKLTHNVVSATVSGQVQQFVRKLNSNEFWPASGGAARVNQTGSRYQHFPYATEYLTSQRTTTLAWRTDDLDFTLTNPDGDVITYTFWRPYYPEPTETLYFPQGGRSSLDKPGWRATSWSFPDGQSINFTYSYTGSSSTCQSGPCDKPRLTKVENAIGRKLTFTGDWDNPATVKDDANRTVTLANTSVTHADGKVTNYGVTLHGFSTTHGDFILEKYLDSITEPGHANANHKFDYDVADKLRTYANAHNNAWTYLIGGGARGATRDPYGNDAVEYYDRDGNKIRSITKTGETTLMEYDGAGRLIERIFPEGNRFRVAYDKNSNVIQVKHCAKTDANCASGPLTTSATYHATWKTKPTSVTDPMGNVTNISYWGSGSKSGKVRYVDQPAAASGEARPRWTYDYDANGRLVSAINPEGEATSASYGTKGVFAGITVDPGGLGLATAITAHNAWGDPTSVNGPRTDVTDVFTFTYDAARRPLTATDPMGSVMETRYDAHGWPVRECVQIEDGAPPIACAGSSSGNQSYWAVTYTAYSATGKPEAVRDRDGHWSYTYYDALDRPVVTVDAMGRKTRTVYDAAGRTVKVIKAWEGANDGTGASLDCSAMRTATAADPQDALQQCYQQYGYTPNGQIEWVNDANGQRTEYDYDGYDRLSRTDFPAKTRAGVPNLTLPDGSDYEAYTYDANGNMLTKRARSGATIAFFYDKLNRLTDRNVPGAPTHTANSRTVTHDFEYDLAGRRIAATHDGVTLGYEYDNAGRLTEQDHNGAMPVAYDYDEASNVAHITHPDGFVARFTYDALNRLERVRQVNSPGDSGYLRQFAHVTYDRLSRRTMTALAPDNGFQSAARYTYTPRGDLTCLDWNFTGARPTVCNSGDAELEYDFTYNPAGQLMSEMVSDIAYLLSPSGSGTDTYASNGLNQYASINGVSPSYDGNGNMTVDVQGRGFTYDAENVLRHVEDASAATIADYAYYADGARSEKIAGGTTSKFYYDGDQETMETDASGNTLRRYIRLPGSVDEPFLMIDYTLNASCTLTSAAACERYAHQNRIGSVVAVTDSGGVVIEQYAYSPYGVAGGSTSGFPFRFTGQKLDAETGLYYYKARYYDPETGRFLQTDPIGYGDQMNLYAYVGNDPVNATDPTGMDTTNCVSDGDTLECMIERNDNPDQIFLDGDIIADSDVDGNLPTDVIVDILRDIAADGGYSYLTVNERRFSEGTVDAIFNIVSAIPLPGAKAGASAARAARGRRCCFVAGTLVQTDDGLTPIEVLAVGDLVLSRNVETGETEFKPISDLIRRHNRVIWEVETNDLAGESETFRTTDDHPWWVDGRGWVNTEELSVGIAVSTANGRGVIVRRVEKTEEKEPTFNLEVADFHTYFVGKAGALVHNACDDHYRGARAERGGREAGRIKRNGRKYHDSETGNTVYVDGEYVYIESPEGTPVTTFTNPRANTLQRVQDGKWVPAS